MECGGRNAVTDVTGHYLITGLRAGSYTLTQADIDARQTMTCNNIKASGVILYTVQVSTDGTAVSPLLQNCASDSSKFFYLTSANDIVTTFDQIGTNLSKLYVAK